MTTVGTKLVEVVYATPAKESVVEIEWEYGLTAIEAVRRSGLIEAFPEIESNPLVLGLFGVRIAGAYELEPGNRVEICRPLQQDPREMRSELAKQGDAMGRRRSDGER
jgi:putative ubiquitin-RnfH superfamily antitoxin RatB of RatAB toxin-antitoxin module